MFSKLKTFSEDMAKSFNELNVNEAGINGNGPIDPLKELKDESKVLHTETPEASELTQPEDEPVVEANSPTPTPEVIPDNSESDPTNKPEKIQLPPSIRSKLKKFAKYEEKYPILLQAYKTEKRKAELVLLFERVLKENTPVSSISDAGALVEYLNGLTEKTNMLNGEMRRYAKENTDLTKTNISLEDKLEKSTKQVTELLSKQKELEAKLEEKSEVKDDDEEIESLKSQLKDKETNEEKLLTDVELSKAEITQLNEKLTEINKKSEEDLEIVKKEVDEGKSKITELTSEIEKLQSSASNGDVELLNKEINDLKSEIVEKDATISELKSENAKSENAKPSVPNTPNGKGKKKKSKKKKNGVHEPEPEPEVSAEVDSEKLSEDLTIANNKIKSLEEENTKIVEEHRATRSKLELQIEEVENLRESLQSLGDDLVQSRDEIKHLKEKSKEKEISLESDTKSKAETDELVKLTEGLEVSLKDVSVKLQSALTEHEEKSKEYIKKIADLTKSEKELQTLNDNLKQKLTTTDAELEDAKKEIKVLTSEKEGLNVRIAELLKFKSNDTSLKLEINKAKANLTAKDKQLEDILERLTNLSKERDQLNVSLLKLRATNNDLQLNSRTLLTQKSELLTKQELSIEKTKSLSNEIQKLQTDKHKAVTELEKIRSQFESLIRETTSSNNEHLSFKQQYDELSMKTKESSMRIENLEDELSEARNMLQERARESSTMRRLLVDAEEQIKTKYAESQAEIKRANEALLEKQSSSQIQIKKKLREIDELKSISDSYLSKIQDLEKNLNESKEKNTILENEHTKDTSTAMDDADVSFEDTQQTIQTLRQSLQLSTKKVRDFESINTVLKKLNEESNLKFERLSKNYKIITQQYRQMKSSQASSAANSNGQSTDSLATKSPRDSIDSTTLDAESESRETNIAYLKNVLLGFFEHKEQRDMLLPVIKTIFHFSQEDERKFMQALK